MAEETRSGVKVEEVKSLHIKYKVSLKDRRWNSDMPEDGQNRAPRGAGGAAFTTRRGGSARRENARGRCENHIFLPFDVAHAPAGSARGRGSYIERCRMEYACRMRAGVGRCCCADGDIVYVKWENVVV
ncbi:hypothetical protein EVAR_5810_1 [Eumeta japonica]|uniref:Uncharacterized protein n=1 Tax=Eumeta variegata TaxID=151549 RepID=A0A4C1T5B0_EUMVA|nr:hypothetical protein EVAR_5810_1 [Eumeta japonica]